MAEIDYDTAEHRAVTLKATGTSERKACLQAAEEQGSEHPQRDMETLRKRLQRADPIASVLRETKHGLRQRYRQLDQDEAGLRKEYRQLREVAGRHDLPTEPGEWKLHQAVLRGRFQQLRDIVGSSDLAVDQLRFKEQLREKAALARLDDAAKELREVQRQLKILKRLVFLQGRLANLSEE